MYEDMLCDEIYLMLVFHNLKLLNRDDSNDTVLMPMTVE